MSPYRLVASPVGPAVQRMADGALLPADPANVDFQAYLQWVSDGGVADPLPPPAPQVVLSVRPVALRWALRQTQDPTGANPTALAYVLATLAKPGFEDAHDAFEYAVECDRADILSLCGAMGFSAAQVDGVMTLAATHPGAQAVSGPVPA